MHYVYQLKDSTNKIIDIGETKNPELRFRQHTNWKPGKHGHGRWYGRTDITMEVVAEFLSRQEAYDLETELKLQNGLQPTEHLRRKETAAKYFHFTKTCKHCGMEARASLISRWHNDKCKHKDLDQQ